MTTKIEEKGKVNQSQLVNIICNGNGKVKGKKDSKMSPHNEWNLRIQIKDTLKKII